MCAVKADGAAVVAHAMPCAEVSSGGRRGCQLRVRVLPCCRTRPPFRWLYSPACRPRFGWLLLLKHTVNYRGNSSMGTLREPATEYRSPRAARNWLYRTDERALWAQRVVRAGTRCSPENRARRRGGQPLRVYDRRRQGRLRTPTSGLAIRVLPRPRTQPCAAAGSNPVQSATACAAMPHSGLLPIRAGSRAAPILWELYRKNLGPLAGARAASHNPVRTHTATYCYCAYGTHVASCACQE